MLGDQFNAATDGLKNRKRCSEAGAGPYCIKDSEGLGLLCEYGGLLMTFLGGLFFSIRAIESPGGDDDRQWLTFWMIFFFFTIFERYADVLLSQTPRYYECKLAVLVWLMFAEGADKIYRVVRPHPTPTPTPGPNPGPGPNPNPDPNPHPNPHPHPNPNPNPNPNQVRTAVKKVQWLLPQRPQMSEAAYIRT